MNELTTNDRYLALSTPAALQIASSFAKSGCFGFTTPEQAITAMYLAEERGMTLFELTNELHFFENGKISQKASFTQATFLQEGSIIWHLRTNECVAASFFGYKPVDEAGRERAFKRFEAQYELDLLQLQDVENRDRNREAELIMILARLGYEGEATVIRTLADAEARGITKGKSGTKTNWAANAISMLQWRCVTDGVKLVAPWVLGGRSTDVDLQDMQAVEGRVIEDRKSPADKEVEAIQAIIDQHLADAAETKSPNERSRLLGLVADLRLKLEEMTPAVEQKGPQQPLDGRDKAPEPDRVVDATDATVEPPQKPKDDDQLPGIEPPKPKDWRDHKITTFKIAAYKGRALGELSKDEIDVLHASMLKKDLVRGTKELRFEAAQIAFAFAYYQGAQK
jgi:hypothetical protein